MSIDLNKAEADEITAEAAKLGIKTKAATAQETTTDDTEEADSDFDDTEESDEEVVDKSKTETEDDEESEEEDEDSEDEDDEEESEEDDEPKSKTRPRKYIPKDDYDRRKAKWDAREKELLTELDKVKNSNKTSEARVKLREKVKAIDPDLNVESIEALADAIAEEIKESTGKLSPELQAKLDAVDEFMESNKEGLEQQKVIKADRNRFEEGWKDIIPELKSTFPKMNEDEMSEAKKLLGKVWRTKEFYKSDVYRVFSKTREQFESIMSPHEAGLESGRTQGHSRASTGKVTLSKAPTLKELAAAEKRLSDAEGETQDDFTSLDDRL